MAFMIVCILWRPPEAILTHLLEDGYDIGKAQQLLGHNDFKTHVLNRRVAGVGCPAESLRIEELRRDMRKPYIHS